MEEPGVPPLGRLPRHQWMVVAEATVASSERDGPDGEMQCSQRAASTRRPRRSAVAFHWHGP